MKGNSMSDTSLTQRTAVVTGAARGVGAEVARSFALSGIKVGLVDLDEAAVVATAGRLASETGSVVVAAVADVGDLEALSTAMKEIKAELGPSNILVNNAGWTPNKPFVEMTESEWDTIISVNYRGVLNGCRAALDDMFELGGGRIVSIASDAARIGTPKESVYAGAKAAVIGFSKSLAVEVARRGITVNVVSPGTTDTPLLRSALTDDQLQRRVKANPTGRIGTPADVAAAVQFLCSEQAAYITGQVLSVNGGMTRAG